MHMTAFFPHEFLFSSNYMLVFVMHDNIPNIRPIADLIFYLHWILELGRHSFLFLFLTEQICRYKFHYIFGLVLLHLIKEFTCKRYNDWILPFNFICSALLYRAMDSLMNILFQLMLMMFVEHATACDWLNLSTI